MRYVIYVSSATRLMSETELKSLLEVSRERNAADGLTGMLLYKDGSFMQVLEGEEEPLKQTCNRIGRDPRHRGIIFLCEEETAERSFVGWAMGFRSVASGGAGESARFRQAGRGDLHLAPLHLQPA